MKLTDPNAIAKAEVRLEEAREARHSLMTGRAVARFRDQNGEEVQYSKADLGRLDGYILELELSLGINRYASQGPMRVFSGW